jgi:hypothetical protein
MTTDSTARNVTAIPKINDLPSLVAYIQYARSIAVRGKYEGRAVDDRVSVSPFLGTAGGMILSPDPGFKTIVDQVAPRMVPDTIRVLWPADESEIGFREDGFSLNGWTYSYVPESKWATPPVGQLLYSPLPPVPVIPDPPIHDEESLRQFLLKHPTAILNGDADGDHFPMRFVSVYVSGGILWLYSSDGRFFREIPVTAPLKIRCDGFDMSRLNFDFVRP